MPGAEGISSVATNSFPLAGQPGARVQASAEARRAEMAKEFEATFVSMLLKQMRETLEPDGGMFPGDTGDVQGGLFDLFLGRHIADGKGIGLAPALLRQMKPATPAPETHPHETRNPLPARGRAA